MSREIKFRAWVRERNEWAFYYIEICKQYFMGYG